MFGLGNKAIPIGQVTSDMFADIGLVRGSIDELIESEAIHSEQYIGEREAFLYVLGWLAIQTSNLGAGDKHRFSAELTGAWSQSMGDDADPIQATQFLQERIRLYRNALQNSDASTWATKCIAQFLYQLKLNTNEHVALMAALSALLAGMIDAETSFLNEIAKKFKFV